MLFYSKKSNFSLAAFTIWQQYALFLPLRTSFAPLFCGVQVLLAPCITWNVIGSYMRTVFEHHTKNWKIWLFSVKRLPFTLSWGTLEEIGLLWVDLELIWTGLGYFFGKWSTFVEGWATLSEVGLLFWGLGYFIRGWTTLSGVGLLCWGMGLLCMRLCYFVWGLAPLLGDRATLGEVGLLLEWPGYFDCAKFNHIGKYIHNLPNLTFWTRMNMDKRKIINIYLQMNVLSLRCSFDTGDKSNSTRWK